MPFPPPSEKQARILWTSLTALAIGILLALLGLLVAGLGWVIHRLSSVLLPLAIAGIIACLLDPVVDALVKRHIPRVRAILLVFFLAVMLVLGMLSTVVPRLIMETDTLIRNLDNYTDKVRLKVDEFIKNPPFGIEFIKGWGVLEFFSQPPSNGGQTNAASSATNQPVDPAGTVSTNRPAPDPGGEPSKSRSISSVLESEWGGNLISWISRTIPKVGGWFLDQLSKVASWVGLLIGLSLVPVYTFYFLLEKRGIEKNWTDYLPVHESTIKEELVFVLQSINYYIILFFRGQVLVALCDGALLTIGFLAIGLNYAVLLGFAAGILSIVPYLGVLLSLIPALTLAAIQFGGWLHILFVLVIFGLVQAAEGLVISPKIMGDRVGLHPLTIIIAVMVGTTLMGGILGGILAIPLTAALRVLMFRYVWKNRSDPTLKKAAASA